MIFGKHVNEYYKKYWWYFVIGVLSLIIVDIVQLYFPDIIGEIIAKVDNSIKLQNGVVLAEGAVSWGSTNFFGINDYYYYIIIFIMMIACLAIFRCAWRLTLNVVQVKIEHDLRKKLFYHMETLPLEFYKQQKTGGLMAYFTNDIEGVCVVYSDGLIQLCDIIFLGITAFIKMCLINWLLAIVCIIPLIVFASLGYLIEKGQSARYEKRQDKFETLSDMVQENLSGITVIKAFIKEVSEMRRFANLNKENKNVNMEYLKYSVKVDKFLVFLIYLGVAILFLLGGIIIINPEFFKMIPGTKELTVANMTTYVGYYDSIIWPMIAIGMFINLISRAYASLRRLNVILDNKNHIYNPENDPSEEFKGTIEFRNFNFKYPDEDPQNDATLKDINLTIPFGSSLGIIGKTGSGKTTLVNALLKLYELEQGQLYIDGYDIREWKARTLRHNIGYVAQDTFLFSDLIENNIKFANQDLEETDVHSAAQFACVDENIKNFSLGYKTKIGERGSTLSGGQKQRISMARAIAKNPNILILDDSVSAVDSNTEKDILNNINTQRKGRTTILIAHRVSSVENFENIIVMDEGRIVGMGKHEELLSSCSLYQNLVKLQSLEKEIENHV